MLAEQSALQAIHGLRPYQIHEAEGTCEGLEGQLWEWHREAVTCLKFALWIYTQVYWLNRLRPFPWFQAQVHQPAWTTCLEAWEGIRCVDRDHGQRGEFQVWCCVGDPKIFMFSACFPYLMLTSHMLFKDIFGALKLRWWNLAHEAMKEVTFVPGTWCEFRHQVPYGWTHPAIEVQSGHCRRAESAVRTSTHCRCMHVSAHAILAQEIQTVSDQDVQPWSEQASWWIFDKGE